MASAVCSSSGCLSPRIASAVDWAGLPSAWSCSGRQFLLEAVTLTIIGGTVGVLGGLAAAYGISQWAGWPLLVEPSSVVLAVFVSGLIGVFFGWWPAMRAARLDPIDALRHS
jgi:putative ABC transport system permease protein